MKTSATARLFKLLEYKGIKLKPLSKALGLSPSNLGAKKREGRSMYAEEIEMVIEKCPEISLEERIFILTGDHSQAPSPPQPLLHDSPLTLADRMTATEGLLIQALQRIKKLEDQIAIENNSKAPASNT